jgi:Zn-dependent protease
MLFVPPFGAGVVGSKHAAPAWQEAVLVLLGPIPGIALALLVSLFLPSEYIVHDESEIDWRLIAMFDLVNILVFLTRQSRNQKGLTTSAHGAQKLPSKTRNASNLVPVLPLDGGRLVALLLFGRTPRLAVSFVAVSIVLLISLACVAHLWILWTVPIKM